MYIVCAACKNRTSLNSPICILGDMLLFVLGDLKAPLAPFSSLPLLLSLSSDVCSSGWDLLRHLEPSPTTRSSSPSSSSSLLYLVSLILLALPLSETFTDRVFDDHDDDDDDDDTVPFSPFFTALVSVLLPPLVVV